MQSAKSATTTRERKAGPKTPAARARAKERFLLKLAECGLVGVACRFARIHHSTLREWEEHDVDFSFMRREAERAADELVEAEIQRRGRDGTLKPVYYKGKVVGHVREFSDQLLIFHAKMRMAKYRNLDNKVEVEHSGTVNVDHLSAIRDKIARVAGEGSVPELSNGSGG